MACEVEKQEKRELSGKKRGLPTLPEEAVELKREREREREREKWREESENRSELT